MIHWISTISSAGIEGFVAGCFVGSVAAFVLAACLHRLPRDDSQGSGP